MKPFRRHKCFGCKRVFDCDKCGHGQWDRPVCSPACEVTVSQDTPGVVGASFLGGVQNGRGGLDVSKALKESTHGWVSGLKNVGRRPE